MEENRMNVRIVPMTADHLDEVAELERICFSVPWSRNMLAEELDNLLSAFLVALDDSGKVVGYAGVQVILMRDTSPMWRCGRSAAVRASRLSCCRCFWTLPEPISWPS